MNISYFTHDTIGKIIRTGVLPTEEDLSIQVVDNGQVLRLGEPDIFTDYWDGEKITQRPNLPIVPQALLVNETLVITGLPETTNWELWDVTDPTLPEAKAAWGVVGSDQSITEVMQDVGRYLLKVVPPWPYFDASTEIVVSEVA